jgi:hypothetical protein
VQDWQIAEQLTAEGFVTGVGKRWTKRWTICRQKLCRSWHWWQSLDYVEIPVLEDHYD